MATTVSEARIELTWDAVPGATKYYVFRSDAGGAYAYVTSVVDPTTTFLARNLMPSTAYGFELMAVMADGTESAFSASATATTAAAAQ